MAIPTRSVMMFPNSALSRRGKEHNMTGLEWIFGAILVTIYIACLFTVCALTFQKGRTWLGIIGIFLPVLWLIGAFLPPKSGSQYDIAQQTRYRVT
jgi:hypothetical protein